MSEPQGRFKREFLPCVSGPVLIEKPYNSGKKCFTGIAPAAEGSTIAPALTSTSSVEPAVYLRYSHSGEEAARHRFAGNGTPGGVSGARPGECMTGCWHAITLKSD
jgi:hypothetical protein